LAGSRDVVALADHVVEGPVHPGDRAFLAALLHRLSPRVVRRLRLLVHPDTVMRWHRDLINRKHAARSKPK
jgi:hypothetical protein